MKLKKGIWSRLVPVLIIVIATVVGSFSVYNKMVKIETETCWERLRIATESTAQKINIRITDNIKFLDAVSDSYVLTNHLELEKEVGAYLTSVMTNTIFESIDVILPDGVITQYGEKTETSGDVSFEELVKLGTHISPRNFDTVIGSEVIYCFAPIVSEGKTTGMLCGKIRCKALSEIFEVFTYKGESQLYLIDLSNGDYIMDNWHATLGNIYENQWREGLDGNKIDIATPVMNGQTGRVAFYSTTNGNKSYQYYLPVKGFNWSVCVVVQDDVVFANLHNLQSLLFVVGAVEAVLIVIYLLWNIIISFSAAKSEAKAQELELTRATNEAKARFISNMSHDIRTPLNGIVGMLHIINTHREDEELVNDCLRKIEISTHYLSTLTGDMLDINEIESDKLVLENVPIDLNSMADAVSVMVESKAKGAGVDYSIDCTDIKNPCVLGSPVHIERVLVNLITNAIKYSKAKNGRVSVKFEESSEGEYRFIIKDNGIGISEEFQKNMYNPFAQEQITARSSYQGYGLGLTIVYRLVEKMGGRIDLQSKKNEGSTFTVTLPLKPDVCSNAAENSEAVSADLSGIKILLVEDNDFNREIAQVILTDVGAKVVTAVDGSIATEIFAASEVGSFDLILMDIMMPETDGCEATEIIRSLERADAKTVPIFAMTANTFKDEVERCKSAGMNEHIAKPLDIGLLIQKVEKYCIKPDKVAERI